MNIWQYLGQIIGYTICISLIVKPLIEILAIIIGGVWTYKLFIKNRQAWPKAKISHSIYSEKLTDQKQLLRVELKISNIGNVLLEIQSCKTWIQRLNPLDKDQLKLIQEGKGLVGEGKHEVDWILIDGVVISFREEKNENEKENTNEEGNLRQVYQNYVIKIEPGEDDFIYFDFIIDADIRAVLVYSYIRNIKIRRRDFGWSLSTTYDINEEVFKEV